MKRAVSLGLLVLWMTFIFVTSSPTPLRNQLIRFDRKAIRQIRLVTGMKPRRAISNKSTTGIVRRNSHLFFYFILGLLMFNFIRQFDLKYKYILSVLFSTIYAIIDETHQILIIGRMQTPLNILLNTLGSLAAVVSIYLINAFQKRDKYEIK